MVVCFSGGNNRGCHRGGGQGGSILIHMDTNNADREGTTAIVKKYRKLVKTVKRTRVEQIIPSGILPVMGSRSLSKLPEDGN